LITRIIAQTAAKAAEAVGAETKVAGRLSPLASEAATALSTPIKNVLASPATAARETAVAAGETAAISGGEAARATIKLAEGARPTLTLNGKFPAVLRQTEAEPLQVTSRGGNKIIAVERLPARFGDRANRMPANQNNFGMSDRDATAFIDDALKNQPAIIGQNAALVYEKGGGQIGKFAQVEIFNPLKASFDKINKNPDLKLVTTADRSAADLVGTDYVLFNRGTKDYWILDSKPLFDQTKSVPTARAKGLFQYESQWFKEDVKGIWRNQGGQDFRNFIDDSARRLVNFGQAGSEFNLTRIPLPSIRRAAPEEAYFGVQRFQTALQRSGDSHLKAYGDSLNGTLKFLKSPGAAAKL